MSRTGALILISVLPWSGSQAQESTSPVPRLRAGDRVWVSAPDWVSQPFEGRLMLLETNHVTIRSSQLTGTLTTYRIPTSEISRLELNIGKDPLVVVGLPLSLGTLGSILVPAAANRPAKCVANLGDPDCSGEVPDGLVGAMGGIVVGGILGLYLATDRWVVVPLVPAATGSGASVGVYGRLRF